MIDTFGNNNGNGHKKKDKIINANLIKMSQV